MNTFYETLDHHRHRGASRIVISASAAIFAIAALFLSCAAIAPLEARAGEGDTSFIVVKTEGTGTTLLSGSDMILEGDAECFTSGWTEIAFSPSTGAPGGRSDGLFENVVKASSTITLRETVAPIGYLVSPLTCSYGDAVLDANGAMTIMLDAEGHLSYLSPQGAVAIAGNRLVVRDMPTTAKVQPVDAASGAALAGAEFTVTPLADAFFANSFETELVLFSDSVDQLDAQLITDASGELNAYSVHQSKAPQGYAAVADFTVFMDDAGALHLHDTARTDVAVDSTSVDTLVVRHTASPQADDGGADAAGGAAANADEGTVREADFQVEGETAGSSGQRSAMASTGDGFAHALAAAGIAAVAGCGMAVRAARSRIGDPKDNEL